MQRQSRGQFLQTRLWEIPHAHRRRDGMDHQRKIIHDEQRSEK